MMIEIIAPIAIIDVYPGPSATMIMGPSATFGSEFKITKYGSATFEIIGDHHKIAAITVPRRVPNINPSTVSNNVTAVWESRLPSAILSINMPITRDGLLKISGSIHVRRLEISHKPKNRTNMSSW